LVKIGNINVNIKERKEEKKEEPVVASAKVVVWYFPILHQRVKN
jgi:hypothetical protein